LLLGARKMAEDIHEPARDIEVIDDAEIVVPGSGPAGAAAAVAASA